MNELSYQGYDAPQSRAAVGLDYNGAPIRVSGERLNLTDMWKAAGADPSRKPTEWLRSADAQRFVEFLAMALNAGIPGNAEVGNSHFGLVKVSKGGAERGSTSAHWQIGLAYAKYLSPEFHMWCNTVVRERMEGRALAIVDEIDRQTNGISRMLAHKVTGIEQELQAHRRLLTLMGDAMTEQDRRIGGLILSADGRVAALEYVSVRELLNEEKALQKGRNSINRKVGREMRNRALLSHVPVRKCPHSNVWLFPRDFAGDYMRDRGKALVSEHNDRVIGQGVIKFPRRGKKEPIQ